MRYLQFLMAVYFKYQLDSWFRSTAGLPIAAPVESASPHEVKLVEATSDNSSVGRAPERLIGGKAYDSDSLDQRLRRKRGIERIALHKGNRKKPQTQDGRKLRRYKHRWEIE